MKSNTMNSKKIIIPIVFFLLGALIGWFGRGTFGGDAGLKPLSDCEVKCIKDNPNDTKKRLDCMLGCI